MKSHWIVVSGGQVLANFVSEGQARSYAKSRIRKELSRKVSVAEVVAIYDFKELGYAADCSVTELERQADG